MVYRRLGILEILLLGGILLLTGYPISAQIYDPLTDQGFQKEDGLQLAQAGCRPGDQYCGNGRCCVAGSSCCHGQCCGPRSACTPEGCRPVGMVCGGNRFCAPG